MGKLLNTIKAFFNDSKKVSFLCVFAFFISHLFILKRACLELVPISDMAVLDGVIFFIPKTKPYMIWYMLSVPTAFLFFLSVLAYKKFFWDRVESFFSLLKSKKIYYYFIAAVLTVNTIISVICHNNKNTWPALFILWLLMYFSPFIFPVFFKINFSFLKKPLLKQRFFILAAFMVFVYLLWALKPLIFGKIRIMNEFWDIPTFTTTKDGKTFNNTEWINENGFIGFHSKFNIDSSDNENTVFADVKKTKMFEKYFNFCTEKETLISPFFYVKDKGIGFIAAPSDEYKNGLYMLDFSLEEKAKLNESFLIMDSKQYLLSKRDDKQFNDNLEGMKEFSKNNAYQIHWQILNRGYIHHHNHIMAAINELTLGRPLNEIFMQYGFLSTVCMQKTMSLLNSVNYGTYNKIVYSFYLIYFIMAALILWFITKKWHYIAFFSLLFVIAINLLSYQYLHLGPGGSPFRHFFDFPVFLFLYLYFLKNKKIYFIASLLLSILAVLNNIQFGFLLIIAMSVTLFVKNILSKEAKTINFEILSTLLAFICCVVITAFFQQGSMDVTFDFLSGFLSFPIPSRAIVIPMLLIFISYFLFLFMKKENKALAYVFLFALIYTQGLLIFWLRSYAFYHFLPFMAIYAFIAIIFLKVLFDKYPKYESRIMFLIISLLLVLFIPSVHEFTKTRNSLNRVLNTHKLYEWTLPGTNFISDIDPKYFTDSVSLIHKYSPDEKGVYIISKYDNFLPLISGRYSALPVIDLQWYIKTEKDIDSILSHIEQASPKYIFADTDFSSRIFEFDIINSDTELGYLNEESVWRVQRLKQMQKIFITATKNYHQVESSRLLTVYERNF